MAHPSSVTEWLTLLRKNHFSQITATSLTQKRNVYLPAGHAGPSHHRPRVEGESDFSSGNGVPFPACFRLLQKPHPNPPPDTDEPQC